MQPNARIRLLGRFDLSLDGATVVSLESARAESLLGYLLLRRDAPHSRQRLAFLFWPDSTEAQARTNLRHLLHNLRGRLPEIVQYLEITSRTLGWRSDAPHWLDVEEFERLLATDGADGRGDALRSAVALYTGDLLEGCDDEWLQGERDRLRRRHLDALAELAAACEADGEPAEAIAHAERLLRGDPLREPTYRLLMRLHAATGDRARALAVFHVCSSALERELGVEPSAPTRHAYEALLSPVPQAVATPRVSGPPLVGRGPERARLTAMWRSTDAGRAQLVVISGEPGVGKTRLADEFRSWAARRGAATAEACCYPAEGPLPYGPVVAWLRSAAIRPRLHRLDHPRLTEIARLLPELLVELPDLEPPEARPDADLRHHLFDAISAAVRAAAGPLMLVVDDLQHGDRETCQLLHYLLRIQPDARLLVVATVRREDLDADHPVRELLAGLQSRERLTEIELARLDPAETAALAQRLTGAPVAAADAARLYDETEGSPLFVVEALRAGWSAGDRMSPRVQAVIEARLAQLSEPARELLGVAATIGREFGADVLAAAVGSDEDTLVTSLDELWRRRIVREQGGGDAYDFSHDKIREVAQRGISPARRRRLHRRVALALERTHPANPGPVSAQIAVHHEQSGGAEQAIVWYRRAAEAAQLVHANGEAVRLLERAAGLLNASSASAERTAVELEMRTALLAPLVSVGGYASPAVSATQRRVGELASILGVEPASTLLRSQALSAMTGADFGEATRIGQLLRARGERDGDEVLVVEGVYVLGVAAFWQADFATARHYLELAVDRYRPQDRREHLVRFGNDPKVTCLSRLGNTLWFLGQADAARAARSAALAWADKIGHEYSREIALWFGALLALDMDDEAGLREHVTALGVEREARQVRLGGAALRGYLAVLDGRPADGLAAVREAIGHARGDEAPGHQACVLRILLAACVAAGDGPGAVATADRMLDMGVAARIWAPEARRVRAAFLERSG